MAFQEECLALNRALKGRLFISQEAVAVRLIATEEMTAPPAWLERFRRPGQGAPSKMLTCQLMAMVRLYGWQILLTPEALDCPTALITLGWVNMSPAYASGQIPTTPFNQSPEARGRRITSLPRLPLGQYGAMAAAPLGNCPFDPQVVVVYGMPAQIMRLVQAALFFKGGTLQSASYGGGGCSQYITKVFESKECRFILPGNGDRILGHVEEHQMAFSLPGEAMSELAQGIELSHEGGQRYPPTKHVHSEYKLLRDYVDASEHLRKYTAEPSK